MMLSVVRLNNCLFFFSSSSSIALTLLLALLLLSSSPSPSSSWWGGLQGNSRRALQGSSGGAFSTVLLGECAKIAVLPPSEPSEPIGGVKAAINGDGEVDGVLLHDAIYANVLMSRFNLNLVLSENSKYLSFGADTDKDSSVDDYDMACFLVDGSVCNCHISRPWSIDNLTLRSQCVTAASMHFSLLIAKSSDVHQSLIITSPHRITRDIDALSKVTLVIPLVIDDLSRFSVLIYSLLRADKLATFVDSFIVIVPGNQIQIFRLFLDGLASKLSFEIILYNEVDILGISTKTFDEWKALGLYPYAIQMALKLLVSSVVKTDFYICLDADIVLLQDFSFSDIITSDSRAIFHNENRFSQHPEWWERAESFLNISSRFPNSQGFGVTPAILSTYVSKVASKFAQREYDDILHHFDSSNNYNNSNNNDIRDNNDNTTNNNDNDTSGSASGLVNHIQLFESREFWQRMLNDESKPFPEELPIYRRLRKHPSVRLFQWLLCFGRNDCLWSEYTIYRLVADHLELFDDFHIPENPSSSTSSSSTAIIHCANVWYRDQLPWRPKEALDQLRREFPSSKCLFSVVQSSVLGVTSQAILSQIQAVYEKDNLELELEL